MTGCRYSSGLKGMDSDAKFFGREKKVRPPLRSFSEMAQEFGLTVQQLKQAFAHTRVPTPPPQILTKSRNTGANSYYDPRRMREWWAAHQALKTTSTKDPK